MKFRGIDISEFQHVYSYEDLSSDVDFVIIRAGFGFSTIDKEFDRNVEGCIKYKIPYGVYWFSYALNEKDAEEEADFLCAVLSKYEQKPTYPVFFDWEYDSDRYAKNHGVTMTKSKLSACARAFCDRIEKDGYIAGIYTNLDYISRMYDATLFSDYVLWYAQWNDTQQYDAPMWQYSNVGDIKGINGYVDLDLSHVDFAQITQKPSATGNIVSAIDAVCDKYNVVCKEVYEGLWGSGEERKQKMEKSGISYDIAQGIINEAYKLAGEL